MSDSIEKVEKLLGIYKDQSVIPNGVYCYGYVSQKEGSRKIQICPYWSKNKTKDNQESGYCSFLELGDWMENGTSLLWDQCKECGINYDDENDLP